MVWTFHISSSTCEISEGGHDVSDFKEALWNFTFQRGYLGIHGEMQLPDKAA